MEATVEDTFMMRSLTVALMVGLFGCATARAQQPQVVYVEVNFDDAKALRDRPMPEDRPQAQDFLRGELISGLKDTHLSCWDLKALPPAGPARPKEYYLIEVAFIIVGSDNGQELQADVKLKTPQTEVKRSLLEDRSWRISAAGNFQGLLNKYWKECYETIAHTFQREILTKGEHAADRLVAENVPVARGLSSAIDGGAILPLDFANFQYFRWYIILFRGKPADPTVEITSRSDADGFPMPPPRRPSVRVYYRKWNDQTYNPAVHKAALAGLTPDKVFLKTARPEVSSDAALVP
jgi:hypothetical protein